MKLFQDSGGGGVCSPKVYGQESKSADEQSLITGGPDAGPFIGYDLLLYPKMESIPLARLEVFSEEDSIDKKWFHFKRFIFNQDAFKSSASYIQNLYTKKYSPIIIDEIGLIELQAGGFASVIWKIEPKDLYITVRKSLVDKVLKVFHFYEKDYRIINLEKQ